MAAPTKQTLCLRRNMIYRFIDEAGNGAALETLPHSFRVMTEKFPDAIAVLLGQMVDEYSKDQSLTDMERDVLRTFVHNVSLDAKFATN